MLKTILIGVLIQVILESVTADIDPTRFEASNDFTIHKQSYGKWRMADANEKLRWRNATIVYQVVLPAFNDVEMAGLREAMDEFEKETCLKFRVATHKDPYSVIIRKGSWGCNAILGQYADKGVQTVNLDYGCRFYGLFLHELGHTIGLHHEHQHPDRDQGVTINMDNVEPSMRVWFETIDRRTLNMYGVPYDLQSIMHYGQYAFSRYENNKPLITIKAHDPSKQKYLMHVYMKDLSFGDSKRINLMYKCNAHCPLNIPCPEYGFINKNCQCEIPKEFAERRCYDRASESECIRLKPKCTASYAGDMYVAYYNCRKTCNACYVADY